MRLARCGCGKEWNQRGNQTAHCASCHETFSSERGFEDHRTGTHEPLTRTCVYPGDLIGREGEARYSEFVDQSGAKVWRSTRKDTRWDD